MKCLLKDDMYNMSWCNKNGSFGLRKWDAQNAAWFGCLYGSQDEICKECVENIIISLEKLVR